MPKSRRRAAAASILAMLGALLAACAPPGDTGAHAEERDGRPLVLTTFTVLADITRNVAGEHLAVESITKVGAEIHGYEPTPSDLRRASEADLILDNGLGLEAWFARFVESLDVPHVVVSRGVDVIEIAEGAGAGVPNPHAWMSPLNVQRYVEEIVAALSAIDPAHADDFAANGDAYRAELQTVHDDLVAALDGLAPPRRALVTCEGAFSYLARDAGLTEHFLWPVNAERQATPRRVASTIDVVSAAQVPAVFCESTVSDRAMRQVADETGAAFGGILYVDSLSLPDGPVPTYLDLIRHDVGVIVVGLTGGAR